MINLNWVLPRFLRPQLPAEIPLREVEEVIAHANDGDKLLRALLQLAHEQWEQANFEVLHADATAEQRQYRAGYAAGAMDFLLNIRRIRESRAREG